MSERRNRYKKYIHTRHRLAVLARDGFQCRYCGAVEGILTFDHVMPASAGGNNKTANIVVACEPCNNKKADRLPEAAGMELRPVPDSPRPRELGLTLPGVKGGKPGYLTRFQAEVMIRYSLRERLLETDF